MGRRPGASARINKMFGAAWEAAERACKQTHAETVDLQSKHGREPRPEALAAGEVDLCQLGAAAQLGQCTVSQLGAQREVGLFQAWQARQQGSQPGVAQGAALPQREAGQGERQRGQRGNGALGQAAPGAVQSAQAREACEGGCCGGGDGLQPAQPQTFHARQRLRAEEGLQHGGMIRPLTQHGQQHTIDTHVCAGQGRAAEPRG